MVEKGKMSIDRPQSLLWPTDYDVHPRNSRVIYPGTPHAVNAKGRLCPTKNGDTTWTRIGWKDRDLFGATVHPRKPERVDLCIAEGETYNRIVPEQERWEDLEGPERNAVPYGVSNGHGSQR
jgi:hypothetical protein